MALEKIVIVSKEKRKKEAEEEEEEELPGTSEEKGMGSDDLETETPLGVQLLEYETQNQRAMLKPRSGNTLAIPFNTTSTRSFEKKVKAHINKVVEELILPHTKPPDPEVVPVLEAVDEINRLSLTLQQMVKSIPPNKEDLTQVTILEEALEKSFPEQLFTTLAKVPENQSQQEESGKEMKTHWKAFEVVDSIMDQEIEELAKLSGDHSRLMDKIYFRVQKLGQICKAKMENMQRSLHSYRTSNESLEEKIDYLTRKVEFLTEVASTGSHDRKKLESDLSDSNQALNERNAKSSDLMAQYFAEKTILTSELSIYKQQIITLEADREKAVLSATKSLSTDLTVALSEWESMEQKLLILEHQVKKAQADSSESLVKIHKNATVQTENTGKDFALKSQNSSQSDLAITNNSNNNNSEPDIMVDTTLGPWKLMHVTVGQNQPVQWVLSTITAIYNDAIKDDLFIQYSQHFGTFRDFVRKWHFSRYGLPQVAETNLADLIISVHRIARSNPNVRLFAYFCGIWDNRSKVYNEQVIFILYVMQCLSSSKDVSCLFPDEGNFWIKPLEVYEVISQIFNTMNCTENVRTFMGNYVEQLLHPVMDMYKSEDLLSAMQSEWDRQMFKMCAKLEAFHNFVVPEGNAVLPFDEFALILGNIAEPEPMKVTAVYDECRSLCLETKVMTLEMIQVAILRYGIGLWTLNSFPDIVPMKTNEQTWSKNKMPQKSTGNPLFTILDHVVTSKMFDMSVADADELKVKLGVQSIIVKKFIETYDTFIREYKDRVDAEAAWRLYRKYISQVNSGRKSNGHFWTKLSETDKKHFYHGLEERSQSQRGTSHIESPQGSPHQGEAPPSSIYVSPTSDDSVDKSSPNLSKSPKQKSGVENTANFLIGNF